MNTRTGQVSGCLFALLQALLYSTMGILGKLLYATGLTAEHVVILRFFATTVILGIFMIIWHKERLASRQPVVYVQGVLFFVTAVLYFMAVERMNAGITTVLFYLFPALVALINIVAFHERLSLVTGMALALCLIGMVFVSGIVSGALVLDGLGIACAIGSCAGFAVYSVLIRTTGSSESAFTVTMTVSWVGLLCSCVCFAPSVPMLMHLTVYQWGIGALIALFNTIIPIILYIVAIKHIGSTKASLISISEAPFSLALAFLILGETLTPMEGIGVVLIAAGIVCVTVAPTWRRKARSRA